MLVSPNATSLAFVPARSGSKRIGGKNIRPLGGHPLLAYAVTTAISSGVFESVICVTDSPEYAEIAMQYGAEVPALRPPEISMETSPDIEWLRWVDRVMAEMNYDYNAFAILRPTNPFRTQATLRRAMNIFLEDPNVDSLRGVRLASEHPGKMWVVQGDRMLPLLPFHSSGTPWHSSQTCALPDVFVQDGSLELSWRRVIDQYDAITGLAVRPFITPDDEQLDLNTEKDWNQAEQSIQEGVRTLPTISQTSRPRHQV